MHAFDRRTNGQTDRRTDGILIVGPRLHSMQRGKNEHIRQTTNYETSVYLQYQSIHSTTPLWYIFLIYETWQCYIYYKLLTSSCSSSRTMSVMQYSLLNDVSSIFLCCSLNRYRVVEESRKMRAVSPTTTTGHCIIRNFSTKNAKRIRTKIFRRREYKLKQKYYSKLKHIWL